MKENGDAKERPSPGAAFLSRKRSRSSSGRGFGAGLWAGWTRAFDRFRDHPKILLHIFVAIVIVLVVLDFAAYSIRALPTAPDAIVVTGARHVQPQAVRTEIVRKLRTERADNLLEADLPNVSGYVLRQVPAIRKADLAIDIGRGIMTVAVTERTAVAVVRAAIGWLNVDSEGMLYTSDERPVAPLTDVQGLAGPAISAGRHIQEHPYGEGALRILQAIPAKFPRKLKTIRVIRPDYYELIFTGDITVKADPANISRKVENLRNVFIMIARNESQSELEQAPDDGRRKADRNRTVSYIDVRFQKDVISYKTETPEHQGSAAVKGQVKRK